MPAISARLRSRVRGRNEAWHHVGNYDEQWRVELRPQASWGLCMVSPTMTRAAHTAIAGEAGRCFGYELIPGFAILALRI